MLSKEQILERNKLIADNGRQTRMKRAKQICKTFKFKIDWDNLNLNQKETLKMMFVEAKWIYNYLLSQDDIYSFNYRNINSITHKDKNKNDIPVNITHIKSSVKQELISQIINQIKGLSTLKKKGYKIGKLKFKSEFNSIKLKQYNVTHYLKGNKFKIQGIKTPIRVMGLHQLKQYSNIDYTTANLLYDGINYFISLTCFIDKDKIVKEKHNNIVGIDMGVSTTLTLSNGEKYDISIEESERLKKLQAKLARQIKGSNNRYKTIKKLRKEYNHINNIKGDITNKLVRYLLDNYDTIVIQDEQITKWKEDGLSGSKIQHSILGRIKNKLVSSDKVVILDKWFPTSKFCSNCGNKKDRDIHVANNIIYFYLKYYNAPGTDVSMPVKRVKFSKQILEQESITFLV